MNEPIRTQWQIRCAFSGFCKQVLKREAINASRDIKRQQLRDNPFAFLAALMACPKALKSNFSLFYFIVISPNYILLSIFLSRYEYTHHSMDRNRAYISKKIIPQFLQGT